MIPNTKHFRMRTNGKVVQGEQRYLETSGLSVGFRKAVGKPFTHQYTSVKWLKPGKTALNRRRPKIARCYALWYSLKVVCAVA